MDRVSEARLEPRDESRGEGAAGHERAVRNEHRPRSRMRAFYFAAAAFWGFVAGSAAVIACLQIGGQPVSVTPTIVGTLVGAAVVAVSGGVVVALAYREAAHRRR